MIPADMTKGDIAWILKRYASRIGQYKSYSLNTAATQADIEECAEIIYIVTKNGFGDCYNINEFTELVEDSSFMDYDGHGYWCDEDGNQLGYIHCDVAWLKANKPEKAKYILWYNK